MSEYFVSLQTVKSAPVTVSLTKTSAKTGQKFAMPKTSKKLQPAIDDEDL